MISQIQMYTYDYNVTVKNNRKHALKTLKNIIEKTA